MEKKVDEVLDLLDSQNIIYKIYKHEKIVNVSEAFSKLNLDFEKCYKTIVFKVDNLFFFFVVKANDKLDYKKAADSCGVNRKKCKWQLIMK